MKKVILAYSGGLDTSCCLTWLKDKGFEVVAFTADLGQGIDFKALKKRAKKSGASKFVLLDLRDEFIKDYIFPALKANCLYEGKYLLSTALGRPLIAKYLVGIAHQEKAKFIAHGSTGKGNDQVRFEVSVGILNPRLKVIAPLREWEFKSREEEIDYLKKKNLSFKLAKDKPYSIDRNLWGVSIECGPLEDPACEPPNDAYQITKDIKNTSSKPKYIDIYFKQGLPIKLNAKKLAPRELIAKLNKLGASYGVGRTDLVEDRLIGIKSREVYEAPGAWILYAAHRELESLILDRETLNFKEMISLKYSRLIYYGLWFTPLREALDRFVESTQKRVSGQVKLKLYKGNISIAGRKSIYSLYRKKLATYSKESKFDQSQAEGFIKLWGMPYISSYSTSQYK